MLDICQGDTFDPTNEEAQEFLFSFKCYRVPRVDNIRSIILELAHQEMIQKPRYVLNCWTPILSHLKKEVSFQTIETINELYKSKEPTAKKIVKLFVANPTNDAERQSLEHLKRFTKSLEGETLKKFFHFCTGSDMITCDSIQITFNNLDGFQRRPVARTCIPMIELATTYDSYPALAEEFTNILKEDQAWSFDIVWMYSTSVNSNNVT